MFIYLSKYLSKIKTFIATIKPTNTNYGQNHINHDIRIRNSDHGNVVDCPICLQPVTVNIACYCKNKKCKAHYHRQCIQQWKQHNHGSLKCVLCTVENVCLNPPKKQKRVKPLNTIYIEPIENTQSSRPTIPSRHLRQRRSHNNSTNYTNYTNYTNRHQPELIIPNRHRDYRYHSGNQPRTRNTRELINSNLSHVRSATNLRITDNNTLTLIDRANRERERARERIRIRTQ